MTGTIHQHPSVYSPDEAPPPPGPEGWELRHVDPSTVLDNPDNARRPERDREGLAAVHRRPGHPHPAPGADHGVRGAGPDRRRAPEVLGHRRRTCHHSRLRAQRPVPGPPGGRDAGREHRAGRPHPGGGGRGHPAAGRVRRRDPEGHHGNDRHQGHQGPPSPGRSPQRGRHRSSRTLRPDPGPGRRGGRIRS